MVVTLRHLSTVLVEGARSSDLEAHHLPSLKGPSGTMFEGPLEKGRRYSAVPARIRALLLAVTTIAIHALSSADAGGSWACWRCEGLTRVPPTSLAPPRHDNAPVCHQDVPADQTWTATSLSPKRTFIAALDYSDGTETTEFYDTLVCTLGADVDQIFCEALEKVYFSQPGSPDKDWTEQSRFQLLLLGSGQIVFSTSKDWREVSSKLLLLLWSLFACTVLIVCIVPLPTLKMGILKIEGMIGQGSFGVVFKGKYTDVQRRQSSVAVKFAWQRDDSEGLDALMKEKEVLQVVPPHQNIPKHYEGEVYVVHSELSNGLCIERSNFIVLEKMSRTLQSLMHASQQNDTMSGSLTYYTWLMVFLDISMGLEHLHAHGVGHFDLKPGNILLDDNLTAKISDFGCSRIASDMLTSQPYRHGGTKRYLPPECQLAMRFHEKIHVALVDVYSLGVIMWECITGEERYLLNASWCNMHGSYPGALRQLILACLEFNPENRPSCRDVSARLTALMQDDWGDSKPPKQQTLN